MNREIKFRFWNTSIKCIYGDTGITSLGINDGFEHAEINNFIPMQYTGLKDEDGKEIYEGDILNYGYKISVVVWYDNAWYSAGITEKCCEPVYDGKNPYTVYLDGGNCVEMDSVNSRHSSHQPTIIGNIYENPDLLK